MAATRPSLTRLGLALALAGPGAIALGSRLASGGGPATLATGAPWLAAFALLTAAVALVAVRGEGQRPAALGFGGWSAWSVPCAALLALVFIFVFGPLAGWALQASGLGSFSGGQQTLGRLPAWFLALDVVVVAAAEEWLYRGYAIERLQALTGSAGLAGAISLGAFFLAHLPLWGLGVALTTLVSGGLLTGLYLWRRDIGCLILAHVLTDLWGLVIAPALRA
jgi:membrane protease YdiL (CAAX protease family)